MLGSHGCQVPAISKIFPGDQATISFPCSCVWRGSVPASVSTAAGVEEGNEMDFEVSMSQEKDTVKLNLIFF